MNECPIHLKSSISFPAYFLPSKAYFLLVKFLALKVHGTVRGLPLKTGDALNWQLASYHVVLFYSIIYFMTRHRSFAGGRQTRGHVSTTFDPRGTSSFLTPSLCNLLVQRCRSEESRLFAPACRPG